VSESETTETTEKRIHAFDFLRASAMQLGIVYHVANFYSVNPDEMATAEKSHSVFFDVLFGLIHPFRMPLFFLMSGFFASLTFKKGEGRVAPFLRVRRRRLLWPFLLSLVFLKPIVDVINLGLYDDFHPSLMEIIRFRGPKTGVYWFLYYLMMYSVVAAGVGALFVRKKTTIVDRLVRSPWATIACCVLPTAAVLVLLSPKWTDIGFGESFVPMPGVFLYYGAFFLFGWWLEARREAIESMRLRRGLWLALALVSTIAVVVLVRFEDETTATAHPLRPLIHCACGLAYVTGAWTAVFALIGFASQHLSRPLSPFLRFTVAASYWTYLVHLPIAIAFTWALIPLRGVSCFVKAPLVMLLTSATAQLSFVFIQPTWVGSLLRGGGEQKQQEPSSSALLPTARRLVISTVIAVLVGSHVWAMLAPYEDWPLGANAMFSFDTPPATDLYRVSFSIEGQDYKTRPINAEEDLQFDEMFLKRQFFAGFYGSTHPRFPQRWSAGDTPEAFQARMEDFGQRILIILERNNVEVNALRIEVSRVDPHDPDLVFEGHLIARIVPKKKQEKDPS
jgi:glucans biosynthesis protein C